MNWSLGLFRIWVVMAFVWVGLIGTITRPDQSALTFFWPPPAVTSEAMRSNSNENISVELAIARANAINSARERRRRSALSELIGFAKFGLVPAIAVFVFGTGLLWAFRGFARPDTKSK